MLNQRLTFYMRHVLYNLRGGFLIRPLLIALALGATGAVLSAWEETHPGRTEWVPTFLFPSNQDPQVAQLILSNSANSI